MAAPVLVQSAPPCSWLSDHPALGAHRAEDMAQHRCALGEVLAGELSGAAAELGVTADEILLAAMSRTICQVLGEGLLEIGVDTGNWGGRAVVDCVGRNEVDAAELLAGVGLALRGAAPAIGAAPDVHLFSRAGAVSTQRDVPACLMALDVCLDKADIIVDWWFDARCFDPYTIDELAEQFPRALAEITSEAGSV